MMQVNYWIQLYFQQLVKFITLMNIRMEGDLSQLFQTSIVFK